MTCCLMDQRLSCSTKPSQMLAEALRLGHARCVVLFTIERHTDTLSSGWFHGSDSPYSAVCSIHSIGLEVESSYCLHRFSTNHEIRWNQENQTLFCHRTDGKVPPGLRMPRGAPQPRRRASALSGMGNAGQTTAAISASIFSLASVSRVIACW